MNQLKYLKESLKNIKNNNDLTRIIDLMTSMSLLTISEALTLKWAKDMPHIKVEVLIERIDDLQLHSSENYNKIKNHIGKCNSLYNHFKDQLAVNVDYAKKITALVILMDVMTDMIPNTDMMCGCAIKEDKIEELIEHISSVAINTELSAPILIGERGLFEPEIYRLMVHDLIKDVKKSTPK